MPARQGNRAELRMIDPGVPETDGCGMTDPAIRPHAPVVIILVAGRTVGRIQPPVGGRMALDAIESRVKTREIISGFNSVDETVGSNEGHEPLHALVFLVADVAFLGPAGLRAVETRARAPVPAYRGMADKAFLNGPTALEIVALAALFGVGPVDLRQGSRRNSLEDIESEAGNRGQQYQRGQEHGKRSRPECRHIFPF